MSALKKISGYKGVCQLVAAGDLQFFIVADNLRDLETLYHSILEDADPFTPETCNAVIIVAAGDLRKIKSGKFNQAETAPNQTEPSITTNEQETKN
jgi:hypothetical protein